MKNSERDKLIIIDGNSLVNRAFYALPSMLSNGKPMQAVYGFATMLIRMIQTYKPKYIAVAFDLPAPTFRHKMYDGYKATRRGMPDDLAVQLAPLKEMLSRMNIRMLEKAGYEADDIIGTFAGSTDCFTYIVTGDRDSFQLIDDTTRVILTKRGITDVAELDREGLKEYFGLYPEQIVDYKAIAGDTSDCIPGIGGIGDKGAHKLLEQYASLDGVYAHLDEISPALVKKLEAGKESAELSRTLAKIDTNVPLSVKVTDCPCVFPFGSPVLAFFAESGFKSLLKRKDIFSSDIAVKPLEPKESAKKPDSSAEKAPPAEKIRPRTVNELSSVNALKEVLANVGERVAIDISESEMSLSPCGDTEYRMRFSSRLDDFGRPALYDCVPALKTLMESDTEKAVYDAKSTVSFFMSLGVDARKLFDVKLARYVDNVLEPNEPFAALCESFNLDPEFKAASILRMRDKLSASLAASGLDKLFYELEMPLVYVLNDMERSGFKLDIGQLEKLGREYTEQEKALESEICEMCGTTFNIKSPKQLAKVLFEDMKLPYPNRSKTYSTGAEILEQIADSHPVVDKILEYRTVAKLNSTYVVGLKKLTGADGIIHTDFRQAVAATGRLSSAEPNLQNIPVRDERGKCLRAMFTSRTGYTLVSADYSQIELRLLAHFSGDKILRAAYADGEDVHAYTAAQVFGVPVSEVTPQMRREAKAVNFGIIYGISDFGLARNVKISRGKAKEYIDNYFNHFPAVKGYLDESVRRAREDGYASTLMGRRRNVPELRSSQYTVRKFGERVAMNMPLQGSAADIIKKAMIDVHKRLKGMKSRLILQIHDELIVEAADDEVELVKYILKDSMESAVRLDVPLTVDIGQGKSWIDC